MCYISFIAKSTVYKMVQKCTVNAAANEKNRDKINENYNKNTDLNMPDFFPTQALTACGVKSAASLRLDQARSAKDSTAKMI